LQQPAGIDTFLTLFRLSFFFVLMV
jgi:hypothetical protein